MNFDFLKRIFVILSVSIIIFFVFMSKTDIYKTSQNNLNISQKADVSEALNQRVHFDVAYVSKVIDGDSFVIESGEEVRLIGIDAPEFSQPYSLEATNFLKNLILNKEVKLEVDINNEDRYGRLLRYVYLNDMFINAEIVRLGYANIYSYPPDIKYQEEIIKAEESAKDNKLGFWRFNLKK